MVSAGEASGDAHAAHALEAFLKMRESSAGTDNLPATSLPTNTGAVELFGMGADQLEDCGCELLVDCRDLAVIGFVDVILNYHRFMHRLGKLRTAMRERKPDLLLLVDFPDFNLKLAETAKTLGIPVLFYVSPQIWAWRSGRIQRIGQLVDHMACLLPFEPDYYQRAGIPASYVGNPVVEQARCESSQQEARLRLGLSQDQTTIGLLPGSRKSELERLLPVQLEAAELLAAKIDCQFVLPRAPTLSREALEAVCRPYAVQPLIVDEPATVAMRAADTLICASGTATLECALIGTPLVVIYKTATLNYHIMKRLLEIEHISLVNIIAGRQVVTELIQHQADADSICQETMRILDDEYYRRTMVSGLGEIRLKLGKPGASRRVAALIEKLIATDD